MTYATVQWPGCIGRTIDCKQGDCSWGFLETRCVPQLGHGGKTGLAVALYGTILGNIHISVCWIKCSGLYLGQLFSSDVYLSWLTFFGGNYSQLFMFI